MLKPRVVQVVRIPGVEGLANDRAGEGQQANQQERAAAQQRQQQRADARRAATRWRRRDSADWAWPPGIPRPGATRAGTGGSRRRTRAGDHGGEHEQRPPAVAVLDQHAHLLPRQRIADQVADAQDADDRAVGGEVEPLGGNLDESRPADRLRQPVADPREREQRQRAAGGEQQREDGGAAYADEEIAPPAPVVARVR